MIFKKGICPILVLIYLLGIKDGYLALWKKTENKPLAVYQLRVEMLPPEDQKALQQGIPITDEQQLQHILEDYLS